MEEDYYKILGISRSASQTDIQKAYRNMARKCHPDMNPDDKSAKERFQQVQKAYDVLGDTDKREMYDRYGSSFEQMGGGARPGSGAGPGPRGFEDFDFGERFGAGGGFEDIFRQFTGGAGARPQPRRRHQRGADLKHELQIPFKTSVTGGEARLSIRRSDGKVETIEVKIPAGIESGKKIRLRGQGEPSPTGGPAGDILITVRVATHPFFSRRGNNLEVKVPITLGEAARGAKIDVPTPKGTISLTLPSGTSSGKRLRIKGHGVATKTGSAGDLFAVIQITLPEEIDEESQKLVEELEARWKLELRTDLKW